MNYNTELAERLLMKSMLMGENLDRMKDRLFVSEGFAKILNAMSDLDYRDELMTDDGNVDLFKVSELAGVSMMSLMELITDDTLLKSQTAGAIKELLWEKARRILKMVDEITFEESKDFCNAASEAMNTYLDSLSEHALDDTHPVLQAMDEIENPKPPIETGFSKLTEVLNLQLGDYVTIAARPSVGKSAFALNLALNMAKNGSNVLYLSAEMNAREQAKRALTRLSGVTMFDMKHMSKDSTFFTESEKNEKWDALTLRGAGMFPGSLTLIDDMRFFNLRNIPSLLISEKPDVVFYDMVHQINVDGEKDTLRRISRTTNAMKQFALKYGCTLFGITQLNRGASEEIPELYHLKNSGSHEEDSNAVILLYNDGEVDGTAPVRNVCVKVAKNRNGKVGTIDYKFYPERFLFREVQDAETDYFLNL